MKLNNVRKNYLKKRRKCGEIMKYKILLTKDNKIWIWFDDVEDLLTFIKERNIKLFASPLLRFVCKENYGNRYYYMLNCSDGYTNYVLIGANATDYSGHGRRDKELIEDKFRWLGIEERPLSYFLNILIDKIGLEVEI